MEETIKNEGAVEASEIFKQLVKKCFGDKSIPSIIMALTIDSGIGIIGAKMTKLTTSLIRNGHPIRKLAVILGGAVATMAVSELSINYIDGLNDMIKNIVNDAREMIEETDSESDNSETEE